MNNCHIDGHRCLTTEQSFILSLSLPPLSLSLSLSLFFPLEVPPSKYMLCTIRLSWCDITMEADLKYKIKFVSLCISINSLYQGLYYNYQRAYSANSSSFSMCLVQHAKQIVAATCQKIF